MQNLRIFFHLAFIASAVFAYDLGVTNNYKYETSVVVDEECGRGTSGNFTGHGLKAEVQLTAIWQDLQKSQQTLLKIQVADPKLLASKNSAFVERKFDLEKIPASESFFLLKDNRVEKFWDNPSEHSILRNLKRSVASLLQVKRKNGEERVEDVSGECSVLYNYEGNSVKRSIGNCHHPLEDSVLSQPSGVRSSSLRRSAGIFCDIKDDVIGTVSSCVGMEQLKTFSNLWKKSSICITSTSEFILKSITVSKEIFKNTDYNDVVHKLKKNGQLVEGNLFAVSKEKDEKPISNVIASTKSFQESLKTANLAKLKSASAFFKLLPAFRTATKEDILKILENKKLVSILPQILDILAASSTRSSLDAALTYFGKLDNYDENLERYLISLSVLPRPEAFVLKEIKALLEKGKHHEKIEATLVTTLGALLRTYAKKDDRAISEVVEVLDYLEGALKKCKSDSCVLSYIRGLRNAAQPSSIPLLLQYALKGGKPSLEALLAVRNIPSLQLSRESQQLLHKIYHQEGAKQDSSTRAVAAEILLTGNSDDDHLRSILSSLLHQKDEEFSTFVASKVLRQLDENQALRSRILKIIPGYYYSLFQKGKSSLFKRQLMSTDGLNVTYGIEMELLGGGLLKRSSFDVEFETDGEVSNLLSVGMFSEGMSSFAGESSSGDDGDPIAGMELTLLGASLRPYIFFSSTSELMGHAWSGTASEPTPALQGIFSLSDDNKLAVLHNGMIARMELRGAMSTDLSGSIQISLWNRNSQSQVKNSAALLVKGSAVIDMDLAKTQAEYIFYGHSSIDFNTDLEFSEAPFKMCLQMEHPNVVLRHDFQKSVEVTEAKFSLKKTKKRKRFIPSRSYALHQNNNELCRIMKNSEYY